MIAIYDFLINALPWIAIGIFVACSCVTGKAQEKGKEVGKHIKWLLWSPSACFFFVAALEIYSGNTTSGTTWIVLGVANAVISFANTYYREKKKETETI